MPSQDQVYIDAIAREIYNNVIRTARTSERSVIEYSWYHEETLVLSPPKIGMNCTELKKVPAAFCVENTYHIIAILQKSLPIACVSIEYQDVSKEDFQSFKVANDQLDADLSALQGSGGLLQQMARLQFKKRIDNCEIPGRYPYIVVDWGEDSDWEEVWDHKN